jgi:hypothetical protein
MSRPEIGFVAPSAPAGACDYGRQFLREWRLEQLPQFVKQLQATDDVAVEATHRGSTMPGPRRIIHLTLKNNWVFEDFPNFVLREATA